MPPTSETQINLILYSFSKTLETKDVQNTFYVVKIVERMDSFFYVNESKMVHAKKRLFFFIARYNFFSIRRGWYRILQALRLFRIFFLVGLVGLNLWEGLISVVTMPYLAHWHTTCNAKVSYRTNSKINL